MSATVEGFDRSKSESDICDDLVSSSAAVDKSSLSTTTSDLSHGDSSLATWSGKSSSSKDMIDEPVLLTDTEVASPMAKETQQMETEVFPFCKTPDSLNLPGELSARDGAVFTIATFSTDNVNEDSQSLTITEAGDSTAAEFLASDSSSETHLKTLVLADASDSPEQNLTPDDSLQTFSDALSKLSEADVSPMLPLPKVSSASVCYKGKDEQTLDAFAFAASEQIMSEGDRKQYDLSIKGRDDVATARKDELLEDRNIVFVHSDVQFQNYETGALDLSEFGQQRVPIKSLDPLQVLDEVIDYTDPEELLAAALAEINRTIDSFTSKASILPQVVQGSCVAQNLRGDITEPLSLIHQVPLSSDEPISTSGKVARVPPHAVVSVPSSDILPPPMEDILLSCNPQPHGELRDLTTMSISLTDFPELPGELDPSQSDLVPLYVGQTPPSSPPSSEDFPPPPEDLQPLSSSFHFFAEMVASASSDSSTKASTDEQTLGPVSLAEHKMVPIVRTRSPTSCQFSASNVSGSLPCPDKVSGGEPPVTLLRHDKLEEPALECHPGPDTPAAATDVPHVCHPHPDTVLVDKAKPKPPPVMKKPPKPKGGQ